MTNLYRVTSISDAGKARELAEDWDGVVILPLVDPESVGGKWLSSPQNRRRLELKTGTNILVIYPDENEKFSFEDLFSEITEAFDEHKKAMQRIFPNPSIVILEKSMSKCTVLRLRPPDDEADMSEDDLVRRSLLRVIDAFLFNSLTASLLKTEAEFFELIASMESAAPATSGFIRSTLYKYFPYVFRRLIGAL